MPSDGASPSGSSSSTRRPTNPTSSAPGSETSDDAEDDGAARGLKASLFGMLGVAGAVLFSL